MEIIRNFDDRGLKGDVRDEILTNLGHVPVFGGLSREQLGYLADQMQAREYAPGERIFEKDSIGTELHVVMDGIVLLRDRDPGGREHIISTLGRGDSFGEIGFLTGEPRALSAVNGAEPGLQLVLSRLDFERVARIAPDIAMLVFEHVLRLISGRMAVLPAAQRTYLMWGHGAGSAPAAPGRAVALAGLAVALGTGAVLYLAPSIASLAYPHLTQTLVAVVAGLVACAAMAGMLPGYDSDATSPG